MRRTADSRLGWQTDAELNGAVFAWCLRSARRRLAHGALDEALTWARVAAESATRHSIGALASPELEKLLLEIAVALPAVDGPARQQTSPSCTRWLHVLDAAYAIGGHTALVRRWIELDPEPNEHNVLILSPDVPVPDGLARAARDRGGRVEVARGGPSPVRRAVALRERAWKDADVLVLHTHPDSVVPTAALGTPGGPPVILLNHVGHGFWVGGAVADLVLNLRKSTLEWTARHRGIARNEWLPIPISATLESRDADARASRRAAARRMLGLPAAAPVLLTIGSDHKYRPLPGLDFLHAAVAILEARPATHLVAVGPVESPRWQAARERSGGRVRAVGPRPDLSPYHAAADIYLEGFPLSSPTALLEVSSQGMPCVRAPRGVPPPFAFDGLEAAGIEQPADVGDYVREAIRLVDDPRERRRRGEGLVVSTRADHTGVGWQQHLRRVLQALPSRHSIYPVDTIPAPAGRIQELSVALSPARPGSSALSTAWATSARLNLRPLRMADRLLWTSVFRWSRAVGLGPVKAQAAALVDALWRPWIAWQMKKIRRYSGRASG